MNAHALDWYSIDSTSIMTAQIAQTFIKCSMNFAELSKQKNLQPFTINGWFQVYTKFWSRQEERNPL
jgi:hypothetical protein